MLRMEKVVKDTHHAGGLRNWKHVPAYEISSHARSHGSPHYELILAHTRIIYMCMYSLFIVQKAQYSNFTVQRSVRCHAKYHSETIYVYDIERVCRVDSGLISSLLFASSKSGLCMLFTVRCLRSTLAQEQTIRPCPQNCFRYDQLRPMDAPKYALPDAQAVQRNDVSRLLGLGHRLLRRLVHVVFNIKCGSHRVRHSSLGHCLMSDRCTVVYALFDQRKGLSLFSSSITRGRDVLIRQSYVVAPRCNSTWGRLVIV